MSEFVHRKRERVDADMDITPMIDITFLLLIFFLVASKMDQGSELALPEARHGTAVAEKMSAILCMTVDDGDGASIYRGGKVVPEQQIAAADLAAQEREVVSYVEEEMAKGKSQVVIRADKSVRYRHVHRIMQAIGGLPDISIYVAVLERG
jgi:biopolymer transport protein ExbD